MSTASCKVACDDFDMHTHFQAVFIDVIFSTMMIWIRGSVKGWAGACMVELLCHCGGLVPSQVGSISMHCRQLFNNINYDG